MDEVWRLEKIGKDGAFHKRLSSENINTVKDILILLYMDATKALKCSSLSLYSFSVNYSGILFLISKFHQLT